MQSLSLINSYSFGNEYVTQVTPTHRGLLTVLSNSCLHLISGENELSASILIPNAHPQGIMCAKSLDENVLATCGSDGLKLWDLRTNNSKCAWSTQAENQAPMLSLDTLPSASQIATGTELKSADAGVLLWDARASKQVVSYLDSHNDDVTDVKFHPTRSNILLSGSTDGLVNVYDTDVADEDDAVIQGIKFASINKTGFLADNRIFCLSHMETFSIFQATNPDLSDNEDVPPLEFGDIREQWDCEYVCEILPTANFVAVGSNSSSTFKLLPFINEKVDSSSAYLMPGAHGEEVVRSVIVSGNHVVTGGEDGIVRVWSAPVAGEISQSKEEKKKSKKDKKDKKDKEKKKDRKKDKKYSKRYEPY